jgi:hypothetical protein
MIPEFWHMESLAWNRGMGMNGSKLLEIIAKAVAALVVMGVNLTIFGWVIIGFFYLISPSIKIKLSDIYGILALMLVFLLISLACLLFILTAVLNNAQLSSARTGLFILLCIFSGSYLLMVTWNGVSEKRLAAGTDAIIFTYVLGLACLAWPVIKTYKFLVKILTNRKVHGQSMDQAQPPQNMTPPPLP